MAAVPKYKKLFSLFRTNVETGVNLEDQVYNLPLILRKDGCEFRLGQAVRQLPRPSTCQGDKLSSSNSCDKKQSSKCQESSENLLKCQEISEQLSASSSCQEKLSASLGSCNKAPQQLFLIKEILLSGDLATITLVLNPVEVSQDGEMGRLMGEMVVADLASVSLDTERIISEAVARDGMRKVIAGIGSYPEFVQRCVRKHQLAAKLRSSVQLFLSGSSVSRSISLGDVDWRLDPGILGLDRETDYTLEYRIEQYSGAEYVSCHLDLLLGRGWDVRGVLSGELCLGFRVILTLELRLDMKQQLRLDTHAIMCRGDLSPLMDNCSYRHYCVTQKGALQVTCPDIMESMHSARGVSLDWEEFQEDSFKLTSEATHFTEEDIQLSPGSVEEVIREIEGCSFSDKPGELFEGRENIIQENDDREESPGAHGEIEETSAALKKLLTTPTKGFSQLVFNESVPQDDVIKIGNDDEELMPSLSPIKFYHKDQRRFESLDHSLSDDPVSRQTTSTPEVDNNSSDSIEGIIKDESVNVLETVTEKLCDEKQKESENNNVITSSINVEISDEGNNPENLINTLSVSSKVEAYVQSLPGKTSSSRRRKHNKTVMDSSCEADDQSEARSKALSQSEAAGSRPRHDNTVLDESFESEASSRSRLSSRQSDLLSSNMRYNNSGMFYGSALGGQTVCPFPSDWQFQTVPETIDNDAEID